MPCQDPQTFRLEGFIQTINASVPYNLLFEVPHLKNISSMCLFVNECSNDEHKVIVHHFVPSQKSSYRAHTHTD